MAFSNCSKCGKPSNKLLCDNCIAENKYKEERNVANRLNELAVISRQDYELAAKETKHLMERPPFSVNGEVFWDQVRNESFLEDCYYKNKLGSSFKKDTVLNLPDYAFSNIPNWFSKRTEEKSYKIMTKFKMVSRCGVSAIIEFLYTIKDQTPIFNEIEKFISAMTKNCIFALH
jgi:hypothetical protein